MLANKNQQMALSKGHDKLSVCIKIHAYCTSDEIIKK